MVKVVIAGKDYNYIEKIEDFILRFYYEQVELFIYTDQMILEKSMTILQKADCIIIDENIYSQVINKSFVDNMFLLQDSQKNDNTQQFNVKSLDKYSSVNEIVKNAFEGLDIVSLNEHDQKTQVVKISSAHGGSGKTSLALALAKCLAHMDKKVLYINFENINDFQYLLSFNQYIELNDVRKLKNGKSLDDSLQTVIQKQSFAYLRPFAHDLHSIGLTKDIYNKIIMREKEKNHYHFILVDAASDIDADFLNLMKMIDEEIYIIEDNQYALYKTMIYLQNISFGKSRTPTFICNKSHNVLQRHFKIDNEVYTTVCNIPYVKNATIELLSQNENMEKLSMYMI